MAIKKDKRHFNYVSQVFAHITWDILKRFVSFRKCLGTDTPQTSIFPTPERTKSSSENCYTDLRFAVNKDERHFNYVFQVFVYIALVMYKMFVSFRKCLGTNTSRASPFTTPEHQNPALKPQNGGMLGCKNG